MVTVCSFRGGLFPRAAAAWVFRLLSGTEESPARPTFVLSSPLPGASCSALPDVENSGCHIRRSDATRGREARWATLLFRVRSPVPPFRQAFVRHLRSRGSARCVVGSVVEEREPGVGRVLEVEDVEACRALVQPVPVGAWIQTQKRAHEKADRRLVRDQKRLTVAVLLDDRKQSGQRSSRDGEAAFASGRRDGERVRLPARILLRK